MVDTETTGLRPDRAGILSLGAVQFDRASFEPTGPTFFARLALLADRDWDPATAAWWSEQRIEAFRAATDPEGRRDPAEALAEFAGVVGEEPWFWASPAHFDWPLIAGHFEDAGVPNPFHYRRVLDVRTWLATHPEAAVAAARAIPAAGLVHHPLDDCRHALAMLRAAARCRL